MLPLQTLRAELDDIDDALHDLLMRRAAVVQTVAARKAADGAPAGLRPGREAAMLRRLVARHHGNLPTASIVRVWRELLAGSVAMQAAFCLAVSPDTIAQAREHFGALTSMRLDPTPDLAAVRSGAASLAVLPLATLKQWWSDLAAPGQSRLHVVARLPFWTSRPPGAPLADAFAVAATPADPSGADRSLVAAPAAAIGELPVTQLLGADAEFTLVEIEGMLAPDDPHLAAIGARLLGAYARPIG